MKSVYEVPTRARGANHRGGAPSTVTLISVHGDPSAAIGTEGAGGQNVYVRELARALRAIGHPVRVLTRSKYHRETPETLDLDGVQVIRVPCGPDGMVSRDKLFPHLPEFVARAAEWMEGQPCKTDVIHSNYWLSGWVGMELARRWDVSHIHTPHSLGAVKREAMGATASGNPVRLSVEEEIAERADALIATSPADLIARGRHYSVTGRPEVIPCGYNPAIYHPGDRDSAKERWGIPSECPVLAYVGRFDPGKGIGTLMRAFDHLAEQSDVRLLLAGGFLPGGADEQEHSRWRDWVSSKPWAGRVHWLGRLDSEDVADVYRAASMVIVPSLYESFGMVALEAMACGTPVLASDVGGLRHTVVHRETGLLFPVENVEALIQGCEHVLRDDGLRERLSLFAAQTAERCYTWPRVAEQMSRLYSRCLAA
ncbi:MAG: glycosyltransferase [Candidatus Sericytochromatia bacterium]|nr:glycosyltransferase [Candidatus Sericytochromatia bacterium]